jgi:hypothetical protein
MITIVIVGLAVLVAVAVTIAVLERAEEAAWRRVAVIRRSIWQADQDPDDPFAH